MLRYTWIQTDNSILFVLTLGHISIHAFDFAGGGDVQPDIRAGEGVVLREHEDRHDVVRRHRLRCVAGLRVVLFSEHDGVLHDINITVSRDYARMQVRSHHCVFITKVWYK